MASSLQHPHGTFDRARLLLGPGARLFRPGARARDLKAGADVSDLLRS